MVKNQTYNCDICKYNTTIRQNYDKHITTTKHLTKINNNSDKYLFACKKCNKTYNTRPGLWYHGKSCVETTKPPEIESNKNPQIITKEIIKDFFDNNKDFIMNIVGGELKKNSFILKNKQNNIQKTELKIPELVPVNTKESSIQPGVVGVDNINDKNISGVSTSLKTDVVNIKTGIANKETTNILNTNDTVSIIKFMIEMNNLNHEIVNLKKQLKNIINNNEKANIRIDKLEKHFIEFTNNFNLTSITPI